MISHPDREVFPDIGATKEQLAEYYGAVAKLMLPEIANRPLSLLRCPSGISGQCFFQKHWPTGAKSLPRIAITEKHGTDQYVYVRDARDLVALIQEGVVELHPWGAMVEDPDKPDRLIFDFDPAPDVKLPRVMEAARAMRELLDHVGLQSFVKTTGGKGLHVVVPLRRGPGWPEVKEFAHAVAETLAKAGSRGVHYEFLEAQSRGQDLPRLSAQRSRLDRGRGLFGARAARRAGRYAARLG